MKIMDTGLIWFVAVLFVKNAVAQQAPTIISESILPADDSIETETQFDQGAAVSPSQTLDYKPIKPSYQSSGSNVAQIVPPGEPWPANAAGYANFSQLGSMAQSVVSNVPAETIISSEPMSAPVPSVASGSVITLDLSTPGINIANVIQQDLAAQLANAKLLVAQKQTVPISFKIIPPPNAGMDFVAALQNAIKSVIVSSIPFAGTSIRMGLTKSSTGAITGISTTLDIVPGTINTVQPTLPPSTVPEIDLRTSSTGLVTNLREILLNELSKSGYIPGSNSVQNFDMSFSVLPPAGATKDFVRLNVLRPLQRTLRQLVPGSAVTAVGVNTQESNGNVLRQTVNFSVRVKPVKQLKITENTINIPEVQIGVPGPNTLTILEQIINQNAAINPTQPKTLSIPFRVVPPAGTTQQQIQEIYLNPLQEMLLKVNPTGKILKVSQNTLPDGNVIFTIDFDIPATSAANVVTSVPTPQVVPVKTTPSPIVTPPPTPLIPALVVKPVTTTTTSAPQPPTMANRFIQNDEEPEVITTPSPQLPNNAVVTPVVDLTKPNANVAELQNILDMELSPATNPNPNEPKTLAIPIVLKPPAGATQEDIKEKVLAPLGQLLQGLEPTGRVIGAKAQSLPNGNIGSVVYFEVPSVINSKTYRTLSQPTTPTPQPTPKATTEMPKATTEIPKPPQVQIPTNAVDSTPIKISIPNMTPQILVKDIQQGLQEVLKPNRENPAANREPMTFGIPFVIPSSLANMIPKLAENVASLVKTLEPTSQVIPTLVPKVLPDGQTEFVVYFKVPCIEGTNTFKEIEKNEPVVSDQDINLDMPGKTVDGEIGKALVRALVDNAKNPELAGKSEIIDLSCFLPPNETPAQEQDVVSRISRALKELEPTGKVVSANINQNPTKDEPQAIFKFLVPSIAESQTVKNAKNAIALPTVDVNVPGVKLVDSVKDLIEKGLKTLPSSATGAQLFNLKFKLNPFDEKGSITEVLNALKAVDPTGQTVSFQVKTAPDGLEYLDIIYLLPKIQDSILYKYITVKQKPEVVYEAVVNIDARYPMSRLLEKVVAVVGSALDYVKGVQPEQITDLPLNFRIVNSQGMSDAQVSEIISRLLPYVESYINQVLPVGKIVSVKTEPLPNSDDVVVKIIDRTPFEPDNVVVIEDKKR